jgi:hypothetical protein
VSHKEERLSQQLPSPLSVPWSDAPHRRHATWTAMPDRRHIMSTTVPRKPRHKCTFHPTPERTFHPTRERSPLRISLVGLRTEALASCSPKPPRPYQSSPILHQALSSISQALSSISVLRPRPSQ